MPQYTTTDLVLAAFRLLPRKWYTVKDLVKLTTRSESSVKRTLQSLLESGTVKVRKSETPFEPHYYKLKRKFR